MFTIKTYLSNQGFLAGIVPSCSAAPLFLESDSKTIRALLLFDIFSERITHTEREVKRWENLIATLHTAVHLNSTGRKISKRFIVLMVEQRDQCSRLPLWGRSTSPMVRPIRLGRWALTLCLYMGREVILGASGLYTSGSNESTEQQQQ